MSSNPCGGCGAPVEALAVPGLTAPIVPPFCPACAGALAAEDADRQAEATLERELGRAGATARMRRWSLDTYPAEPPGPPAAARAWLAAHRAGERRNLWLRGDYGTGKTGLAWSLVRALVEDAVAAHHAAPPHLRPATPRAAAMLVHWPTLLGEIKESFRPDPRPQGDAPDAASLYGRARRVGVLALDELGGERPTPFAREALARLVEERWQGERPTIVTANYDSQQLARRLGEHDPVEGQRIVSRLVDGAVGVVFEGDSRRRAAGAQR